MTSSVWTIQDRTCVVTGATSGIGERTAEALGRLGAQLVLVGRNREKCTQTAERLRRITGNPRISFQLADLSSQRSIHDLADRLRSEYPRVDVLINNAGAVYVNRQLSVDGIELTFALNVVAPFLLTQRLTDRLIADAPSRVVMVASAAHRGVSLDFDDLQASRHYSGYSVYSRTKLALILLTHEFARRFDGTGVTVNAVHPGFVRSGFGRNDPGIFSLVVNFFSFLVALRPESGARTPVYAASAPELASVSGAYFVHSHPVKSSKQSYDDDAARRLWQVCEQLTVLSGLPVRTEAR